MAVRLLGLYHWLQQQYLNVKPYPLRAERGYQPTLGFRVLCTRQLVESKGLSWGLNRQPCTDETLAGQAEMRREGNMK